MEIPVINRISDFEKGINSLNNPSLISQVSGIEKIIQTYSFWKWGAFIIALLASFSTIINRFKILIIRFRRNYHSLPSQPLLDDADFDFDTDTDSSSVSSDDEEEYDEPSTSSQYWRQVDEDFRVRGSGHLIDEQWRNRKFTLRKRRSSIGDLFSWAEGGKSVVKLWDNLGLGFGLDVDENESLLNVYDVNKTTKLASIFNEKSGFQAVSATSSLPAVVVSAGVDSLSRRVSVSAWDTRLNCRLPAILAEWSPKKSLEKIAAVKADGVEKVFVRGDVTGKLMVGDMRKVSSSLTESDVDTWWDADAVNVSDELVDESM